MTMNLLITGGGTAGHVIPNVVLINELQQTAPQLNITYVGTKEGLEADLINQNCKNIKFCTIASAKLRRYFSVKNLIDFLKLPFAIFQALKIIRKRNPKMVFSKGGYVSLPVVLAAWLTKTTIIIHESDSSPGLTTKITCRIATEIWYSNENAYKYLSTLADKPFKLVPILVRKSLLSGNAVAAKTKLRFTKDLPTILIMGGSLGAEKINEIIDQSKSKLLEHYNLIHICGAGKLRPAEPGYATFEYVKDDLADYYALASLIIGRSGATSLAEWEYLGKPCILIPLPRGSSRGEQAMNAKTYLRENLGLTFEQNDLTPKVLSEGIAALLAKAHSAQIKDSLKLWQETKNKYLNAILSYYK